MNKYIKNKHFKEKALKRAKKSCHFSFYPSWMGRKTPEELGEEYDRQIKWHHEWIVKKARYFDKGFPTGYNYGDTKWYKTNRNRIMRAKTKEILRNDLTDWDEKLYPKFVKTIH